jgi:hypothetical protein
MPRAYISPYLSSNVHRLFAECGAAMDKSFLKRLFAPPARPGFIEVGEHNSVGIALGRSHPTHVSAVEYRLRRIVAECAVAAGFRFTRKELEYVCAADSMAALAFTTAASGHVRQFGLSKLTGLGPEIGLALVILRLNDWVPEVRDEAAKTIDRLIVNDGDPIHQIPSMIADCIELLLDHERFWRMTVRERAAVDRMLAQEGVVDRLRYRFLSRPDPHSGRALHVAMKSGFADGLLVEIAKESDFLPLRLIAVRAILEGEYSWKSRGSKKSRTISLDEFRPSFLNHALKDKYAQVVAAALDHVIRAGKDRSIDRELLCRHLQRKERHVAERAAYILKRSGAPVSDLVREELVHSRSPNAAIALGRFGDPTDAHLAFALVDQFDGKKKLKCLEAAASLGHRQARQMIRSIALTSRTPAMVKRAVGILWRLEEPLSLEEILQYLRNDNGITTGVLLRYIAKLPYAQVAIVIADAASRNEGDERLNNLYQLMEKKRNKGLFQMKPDEMEMIRSATAADPDTRERIARTFGVDFGPR